VIDEGVATGPDVIWGARFAWLTRIDALPEALPPCPSVTVTDTLKEESEVTGGGVYTTLGPVPESDPPVALHA